MTVFYSLYNFLEIKNQKYVNPVVVPPIVYASCYIICINLLVNHHNLPNVGLIIPESVCTVEINSMHSCECMYEYVWTHKYLHMYLHI